MIAHSQQFPPGYPAKFWMKVMITESKKSIFKDFHRPFLFSS
jgi:hypothetical protein